MRCDGWTQTAIFCAALCQRRSLKLEVWQLPPCEVDADGAADAAAFPASVALLRRMLAAKVSRYVANPAAAIAAAEAARAGD